MCGTVWWMKGRLRREHLVPVHEVDVDASPDAKLLHERRGGDGDRAAGHRAFGPDTYRGLKRRIISILGRPLHSVS